MTDSKTARELANRIDCMDPYTTDMADVIEQAILQYASDKDKRIAQLEAEVERLLKELKARGYDVVAIRSAGERGLVHPDEIQTHQRREIASLKSSLAEWKKEEVLWKERETDMLAQLASLKQENEQVKQKPKILVADYEVPLSIFKDIVKYIGRVWAFQTFAQKVPDEIWATAILEWQMDEIGLFSITKSGKKVRMNDNNPSVKLVIVKEAE